MDFVADAVIIALVYATLAAAYSWLGAYARVLSLGHAVFFGIGAYAVAVSNLRGGSPWYGALGGALAAVLLATIIGLVSLRRRGIAFASVMFALGVGAEPLIAAQAWVGPHNVYNFPIRTGFLNLQFDAKWPYVVLAVLVFGVTMALTYALRATRLGLYLHALRTNVEAAGAIGLAALPPRLIVVAASAFVTSVGGSFWAEYARAVDPHTSFAFSRSLDIALAGSVTGPFWFWGAPLAGMVISLLARVTPLHPAGPLGTAILLAQGLVCVLLVALRPDGLFVAPAARTPHAAVGDAS